MKKHQKREFIKLSGYFLLTIFLLATILGILLKQEEIALLISSLIIIFYSLFSLRKYGKILESWITFRLVYLLAIGIFGLFGFFWEL